MSSIRDRLSEVRRGFRRYAGSFVVDNAFRGIARLGLLHPRARPHKHGVEILRDIPYLDTGMREHLLDVYRPIARPRRLPVVLYVHGGGFRILSKDTHWIMGLAFARRGFVLFNINYRLAPRFRYPAAIEDVCHALAWVRENAARFGGDPDRIILAGESAGANLVTALSIATSYRRPEPFAQVAYQSGARPIACIPACGLLQVSDPDRFRRRRKIPQLVFDRVEEVSRAYLGDVSDKPPGFLDLADPLVVLERGQRPDRPLPPFFSFVGTKDPILDDTRRLHAALEHLGVRSQVAYYPGEIHAFHALIWREAATKAWTDKYEFLDDILDAAVKAA